MSISAVGMHHDVDRAGECDGVAERVDWQL
jgi:hypothetical protein